MVKEKNTKTMAEQSDNLFPSNYSYKSKKILMCPHFFCTKREIVKKKK